MGEGAYGSFPLAPVVKESTLVSGGLVRNPRRAIFVTTVSPDGAVLRVAQNMPAIRATPTALAIGRDGGIYITGTQEGHTKYGAIEAPTEGINAFLARLRTQ